MHETRERPAVPRREARQGIDVTDLLGEAQDYFDEKLERIEGE